MALVLGACFAPELEDGKIACDTDGACPPGLACFDGVCRTRALDPTRFAVTVSKAGNGTGTVASTSGIACGADCSELIEAGSSITLTATPDAGSTFVGWGGGCAGTEPCTMTIDAAVTVTATFALERTLVVARAGNGTGTVTSAPAGIACGADCSEVFPPDTMVALSATAAEGSTFNGWSGAGCFGVGTCTVTIDGAKMVTATFSLTQHALTVARAGTGAGVVNSPSGIDCGADCTAVVDYNTPVVLTATPSTGSTFAGWTGGGCTGTGTCTTTITAATTVTATFALTTHVLTAQQAGNGVGTVTSSPAGIACGADCTEAFGYDTSVTLSATPATGTVFTGWSGGGCTGTAACTVTITAATMVTATFTLTTPTLAVVKTGNGAGTVTASAGAIACGNDCNDAYPYGSQITLTAAPATGSTFAGWSGGGCSGTGTCVVTVSGATTVTAAFALTTHALSVSTNGSGAGTISGAGINCGADCGETYTYDTVVTLTASPAAGSSFAGWTGGGCSGTGTCVVTMTSAASVAASFTLITHALTVGKAGTGSGGVTSAPAGIACGVDCTELFGFGTSVTLTATPATGSVFAGWSGGGCSGTGTCVVPITAATTVTATFTITTQTLTVTPAGAGAGTVTSSPSGINCGADCSEPYSYGSAITLTASASPGSTFAGWSGGGCAGTGTCVVTLTAATTVTATFDLGTTAMTVAKAGNGAGTITSAPAGIACGADCTENFTNGTAVILTAAPSAGSTFAGWSGGGCSGTGTCSVAITPSPVTITATFTLTTHALTVAKAGTGSGTVSSTPAGIACGGDCSEVVTYGTSLSLNASASAGSTFAGWSGGGCTGTGTCVVTVTAATTVTATFTPVQYALTVAKTGTGSGTVTSTPPGIACGGDCSEPYDNTTSVALTAAPSAGSTFAGWSGGGCSGTGTCVVAMNAATTVTAAFALTTHGLSVTLAGSGTVTSSPSGISCGGDCNEVYAYGTDVTLTAAPAVGFDFTGWSGGGCVGTGTCELTITSATSVTATFAPQQHVLTVNRAGNGAGSVGSTPAGITCGADCSETYGYNTSVVLTATPSTGSVFAGWSGAGCSGTGTCSVSMTAARSVTATFTLTQHVLTAATTGPGTGGVASSPAGIACPADCTETYNYGTQVTLTATPAAGSSFTGWSGACTGTDPCVVSVTAAASVAAAFTVIPPNIAFVTSTPYTGNLGGLAGADAACQAHASSAALPGTFRALLSTSTVSGYARLGSARGWVTAGLTPKPIADQVADLQSGRLFYPLRVNEHGVDVGGPNAWTGPSTAGAPTCSDWTTTTGTGNAGAANANSSLFAAYLGAPCTNNYRLYCFQIDNQAVVTVPTVTARRAFTTSVGWAPGGGLASADTLCATQASAASLPGTYKALLATSTASAISRFDTSAGALPWARPDHVLLAPTAAALAGAGLVFTDAAPNSNAASNVWYGNTGVWGGANNLTTAGTLATTCNDWTSTSAGTSGRGGRAGFTRLIEWLANDMPGCNSVAYRLACLQE